MKLRKYLLLMLLSILICPNIMANTQGSVIAQMDFRYRVLEFLKQKDFDGLKDYVDSVPNCDLSYNKDEEQEAEYSDPVCTMDRINGKSFLWHVWQKGYNKESYRFNIIEIDAGLYDSLANYYRFLYNAEPRDFDLKSYRNFYNRFLDTWLQERVELILTNLWQPGTIYRKWDGFSAMTGKNIYTTLYISYKLGMGICKYIDDEIKLDKYVYGGGRDRLRTILKEMKQKSEETNTPELFRYIQRLWYHSIAYNEADEAEKEYYQGKKHRKMFELLSEDGWDMFAGMLDGITGETLRREKHNISVDIRACQRIMQKQELCDSFEQGAIRNGFYIPPYVEPSIEEQVQEMQNQLNERLFMYK